MKNLHQALNQKLSYQTSKGTLSIQDLYDLPVTSTTGLSLDDIHSQLSSNRKTGSYVTRKTVNAKLELQIHVVESIIDFKQELAKAARKELKNKEYNQKVLAVADQVAEQEFAEKFAGKTAKEIKAMLK